MLVASAIVASNTFGVRDRLFGSATPAPKVPAVSRVAGASPSPATTAVGSTLLRSQPWWQDVTTLDGAPGAPGAPPAPFTIDPDSVQWRVRPTCQTGHLLVRIPNKPKPLVDAACPGAPDGFATTTGLTNLQVTADAPWQLKVQQEVDVPLVEPPLPAMTAPGATATATGAFYKIDHPGSGNATIYRLADGSYALRLSDFFVSPNSNLEVRLSALAAPHNSEEFAGAPSAVVATLDVTSGSLNFAIPPGVDPTQFKSVVVWCVQVRSAYSAASLGPAK
ncbi:MAG: DM13 domain-containing protein [Actinomycetota bacterium]|nr:DM13 domain-containing protein [Actinomycetota bacterium]